MSTGGDIRDTFFQECEELLEALNDGLVEIDTGMEADGYDPETLNAVFRAVHSIKGGAGAFALEDLVRFAHRFESTLDAVRSGRLDADAALMALFHRAADRLSDLVLAARDDLTLDPGASEALIADLEARLSPGGVPATAAEPETEQFGFVPMMLPIFGEAEAPPSGFRIAFSATRALYASGNDPAHLFRALAELGRWRWSRQPPGCRH